MTPILSEHQRKVLLDAKQICDLLDNLESRMGTAAGMARLHLHRVIDRLEAIEELEGKKESEVPR